jgi:muramoyltetrapeptide carboxypeptidase
MPRIRGGVLFLEDVNEHPYRVERNLLHLLHAGIIDAQKAVVLGQFSAWRPAPLDRGYTLKSAVQALRDRTTVPVLSGLPFGHVPTHVTLPVGRRVDLLVQGRDVLVGW